MGASAIEAVYSAQFISNAIPVTKIKLAVIAPPLVPRSTRRTSSRGIATAKYRPRQCTPPRTMWASHESTGFDCLNKIRSQYRERVVAGTHDDDAVSGARFAHEHSPTLRSIGNGAGGEPTPRNAVSNVATCDAALRCAAEVHRVGHYEQIVGAHAVRERVDELVLHQSQRTEAVR